MGFLGFNLGIFIHYFAFYMPRARRIKDKNTIYSVVTRVNYSNFHFDDPSLGHAFLDHLKDIKKKLQFKLFGFVIMATHVHLLIQTKDDIADISDVMKHINGYFAVKFNRYNKVKGHFWMERFKSKIVQDFRYLVNTIIYFALNPVRAGITNNPLKYKFSSINNVKDEKIFADILDPLPKEYLELIKEFLEREKFLAYVADLAQRAYLGLKYSFDLSKSQQDQQYKNYIGSYKFTKNCSLKVQKDNI